MYIRNEQVLTALKNGTLPAYLVKLIKENSDYWFFFILSVDGDEHIAAIAYLINYCKGIKIDSFPQTQQALAEAINKELVSIAVEWKAFNEMKHYSGVSDARGYMNNLFNKAKLLGLIPEEAEYTPYFDLANIGMVEAFKAKFLKEESERIM